MMDYNSLTLNELKGLAKEKNLKNISGMKKEELINLLQNETVPY